jgi:CBS domain-containing protein
MSLEHNLKQERVIHLDLNRFATVEQGTSVRETVEVMRRDGHHCAVVVEQDALVGIFTDRDILKKVVASPEIWDQPIEMVMTSSPLSISSMDSADKGLALMDNMHFRNVPVVDLNGVVVGTLTHYAIIKYLGDRFPETVYNLPPTPDRVTRKRDGA